MGTIKYQLKSMPDARSIDLPEEYARSAESLVKRVLENPSDLPSEPGCSLFC